MDVPCCGFCGEFDKDTNLSRIGTVHSLHETFGVSRISGQRLHSKCTIQFLQLPDEEMKLCYCCNRQVRISLARQGDFGRWFCKLHKLE